MTNIPRYALKNFNDKDRTLKDLVEIEFDSIEDAQLWQCHYHNINDRHASIRQWVHPSAARRWHWLDTNAYIMRSKDVNIKIREGKNDFYLLGKKKGTKPLGNRLTLKLSIFLPLNLM